MKQATLKTVFLTIIAAHALLMDTLLYIVKIGAAIMNIAVTLSLPLLFIYYFLNPKKLTNKPH